jgi:hypothetical protein
VILMAREWMAAATWAARISSGVSARGKRTRPREKVTGRPWLALCGSGRLRPHLSLWMRGSWLTPTPHALAVYASCSASPPPHATLASRRFARPYLGRTYTG